MNQFDFADGPDVCEVSLIEAVDILNGFSSDGTFNIQINSSKYEVVANSSSVGTDITCPEGNEKVSYHCGMYCFAMNKNKHPHPHYNPKAK